MTSATAGATVNNLMLSVRRGFAPVEEIAA